MTHFKKLLPFIALVSLLFSCGRKVIDGQVYEKVEKRKTEVLVSALDSLSHLRPKYFFSRLKVDFSDTNQNISFKTTLRMVKDSVVNPLITFAAIPIVNSLIRPDSVIVMNKRQKCVIRQDVGFIKQQFGVDFNYCNVEELFLGLPVGFDTTQRYFQITNDPYNYIISSHRKRDVRRDAKGKPERDRDGIFDRDRDKERDRDRDRDRERNGRRNAAGSDQEDDEENVIINYYLSGDLSTIRRIHISSPNDTTTIDVNYLSRDTVENYSVPDEVSIDVHTPRNHLQLQLNYSGTEVNVPDEIHFVIPEGYEECTREED
jgi:hypothetical protein